jgi:uncharacterized protein (TIGR02271 family)
MATKKHSTIVGVFEDRQKAQQAVNELKRAGFLDSQIGVAGRDYKGDRLVAGTGGEEETYAAEGAMAGVATGAGLGALWGLGILAGVLPAIGPAIAGGTLATILSSAAAGAATAGLAGALLGLGMSKEEAEFYEAEFKSGRTIVTVNASGRESEATAILRRFGGYDISSRGTAASATTAGTTFRTSEACPSGTNISAATGGSVLQAHEEKLNIKKRPVETGDVTIRKEVHTERKSIDVPVQHEEVVIERRPASGGTVSATELKEGQEIRVPVREEQVQIEKQLVTKEEVAIGKRKVQETKHVDENLRKEEIKVQTHGDVNVREKGGKNR